MRSESTVASPFHEGEQAVQERLGVRESIEPWARKVVRPYLSDEHRSFFAGLPFVVAASRDASGRPWATIVAGSPGFVASPDAKTLCIHAAPAAGDALHGALGPGAEVGLLGIELATRRRNRVNGRIRAGDGEAIHFEVDQSFGNCPQYIVEREIRPVVEAGQDAGPGIRHDRLNPETMDRIRAADTFFIATGHRGEGENAAFGMDASHRGGAAGFVDVLDERTLVVPDYSGNNHFNTIGNLVLDPRAGLLFVDFETGGLLQLTGRAEIDWDSAEVAHYPGARRLIRFTLEEANRMDRALPIRWAASTGFIRSLRLEEKTRESEDVVSFVFAARDGSSLPDFEAGQHLPIELQIPGRTDRTARTYSLSVGPGADRYRISVKREAMGVASRFLHDELDVGAIISARAPAGDFVLDHGPRAVVLVSAGIGITPMLSMLHDLVDRDEARPVFFVHGARDGVHHPLRVEVADLAARSERVTVHTAYSRPRPEDQTSGGFDSEGRVDAVLVESLCTVLDSEYYVCGPMQFMADIQNGLEERGVPESRIHTESFGPTG